MLSADVGQISAVPRAAPGWVQLETSHWCQSTFPETTAPVLCCPSKFSTCCPRTYRLSQMSEKEILIVSTSLDYYEDSWKHYPKTLSMVSGM